MSDYMGDLSTYFAAGNANAAALKSTASANSSYELDMTDFLTLMVTELQNQSIDNTADTSEMLNQLVQMQMITAITNLTDSSIMSYAASLVGKTVTVGQYDAEGVLQELVGEVTGTGTMGGEQVVFVNDKYYYMNEIMAVGVLPEVQETENDGSSGADAAGGAAGSDNSGADGESGGDAISGTDGVENDGAEG